MPLDLQCFRVEIGTKTLVPYVNSKVQAGFPSPAEDHLEKPIDITDLIVKNPEATFYVKVQGCSMENAQIFDGDILVVDRSLEAKNKNIVLALIDGEFTVKRMQKTKDKLFLLAENPQYKPIEVTPEMDFRIWGVVTNVIHSV